MRRLPIYFLIDISESMVGDSIQLVEEGMGNIIKALKEDPYALETVHLSVIVFAGQPRTLVPLQDIINFYPPKFPIGGGTSLSNALGHLMFELRRNVVPTTAEQKGDWKPLVFIMTDGGPTDQWQQGLAELQKRKPGLIVACGAGSAADTNVLKQISEVVVSLDTADSASIKAFFKWVSASISTGSQKIEDSGKEVGGLNELPPPPPEVNVVV